MKIELTEKEIAEIVELLARTTIKGSEAKAFMDIITKLTAKPKD